MKLSAYRWFRNPRGLHHTGPLSPLDPERYIRPQMGWAKLTVSGKEHVQTCAYLIDHQCMPVIRIYREHMGAMLPLNDWYATYEAYLREGCRWFELYSEPNRDTAWAFDMTKPVVDVTWENEAEIIKPLMDRWVEWAERIIEMGGYPAFPAFANRNDERHSTVLWIDACLKYLKTHYEARFRAIAADGLWCATHPYILNHFYQEPPGGPPNIARPYYQQRGDDPGWHFEYPADPLQQSHDPGRTVFGGTADAPHGDTFGLIAAGYAFQMLLGRHFQIGPLPVVGTEGGVGQIPHENEDPFVFDTRYPPYSQDSHAEATIAMWNWIVDEAPPWFFGVALGTETEYYDEQGAVKAIERMIKTPPRLKDVPRIDPLEYDELLSNSFNKTTSSPPVPDIPELGPSPGYGAPALPPPGMETFFASPQAANAPKARTPDLHWIVVSPDAAWFFQAARLYWPQFRPTIMTTLAMLGHIPDGVDLVVTVLVPAENAARIRHAIQKARPTTTIDIIAYKSPKTVKEELDRRAADHRRFDG